VTSARREAAEGRLGHIAADRIVDEVDVAPPRQRFQHLAPVGLGVVDDEIRATRHSGIAFFLGGGGRNDCRAHRFRDIDGRHADAARRAEHQHGFAGLEVAAGLEAVKRRAIGDDEAGGGFRAHVGGHRNAGGSGKCDPFRQRAHGRERHHALAHQRFRRTFAERDDLARDFASRREGQRRLHLIEPGDEQRIDIAEARRFRLDDDLSAPGHGIGQLFKRQRGGRTVVDATDGLHFFFHSFWSSLRGAAKPRRGNPGAACSAFAAPGLLRFARNDGAVLMPGAYDNRATCGSQGFP